MNSIVSNTLSLASRIKRSVQDGWENINTGLGVSGKDKRLGGRVRAVKYTYTQLENLHDSDDIAKKVVNLIPDKGTKKWIEHKIQEEDGGKNLVKKIVDEEERLQVRKKFKQAWAWGRLYGGAVAYISVEDGLDPSEPLNPNRITKVNSLTILHKNELSHGVIDRDIDSPYYGLPKSYMVSGSSISKSQGLVPEIHRSRLLFFHGSPVSQQRFEQNSYWHDSVLVVLFEILRDFNGAYNTVFHTIQDFNTAILRLKDLAEIVATDDAKLINERLRLMNLSKSVVGSIILDADEESMENITVPLTNLDKVLDKVDNRLVMATGMPHTVILGDGATGTLSGKGESEEKNFNSLVEDEQVEVLEDNLNYFYEILLSAKQGPTNGRVPKSHTWQFVPLMTPPVKEMAESKLNIAKADEIYMKYGALSANEVAKSRFGGDEYSFEISIDMEDRDEQDKTNEVGQEEAKKIIEGEE